MAVDKPVPVPEQEITSIDVVGFAAGLNLNGAQNAPINSFVDSKDVELSIDGFLGPRRQKAAFLPDTDTQSYQKLPVEWQGNTYYFTLDNSKARFCQEGDTGWTDCGGSNTLITNNGGKPELLRILDKVIVLNGDNGDKICYIDLNDPTFPVVKYVAIADPTDPMTAVASGGITGATSSTGTTINPIYYAYSYTTTTGETELSPILTYYVDFVRDQWSSQSTPGLLTLTRPGTAPVGAIAWKLYIGLSSTAGSIQPSDMLELAAKLDLKQTTFADDGTLGVNLGSVAPLVNSTDGFKVAHGIVEDGNPILFGDPDNTENIYIGGGGIYAMDFSTNNGGYLAQPEQGTNFKPTVIIGFRNGQGAPSLTVLYSNTEGLSKQSVLEQKQVNYGNSSFNVWGVTEQHYGAAGVAAANSAINYNGKLLFLSTDGFMSANTEALRQNVISIDPISVQAIDSLVRSIKNIAMKTVVGAGWNNKFHWIVPSADFDTPQQILISDDNNKGAWYTLDIPGDWIGVISPLNAAAFVYVVDGTHTYKLIAAATSYDTIGGIPTPFSTGATGALIPMGGTAHNHWQADVQVIFDVRNIIGDITVGVTYRNQNGKLKTKTKTYVGPAFVGSASGGWGDTEWSWASIPEIPGWGASSEITDTGTAVTSTDKRIPIQIDDLMNEAQWFFSTSAGFNSFQFRSASFEGINLGVRPDLQ